jgi:hypothetical protein
MVGTVGHYHQTYFFDLICLMFVKKSPRKILKSINVPFNYIKCYATIKKKSARNSHFQHKKYVFMFVVTVSPREIEKESKDLCVAKRLFFFLL